MYATRSPPVGTSDARSSLGDAIGAAAAPRDSSSSSRLVFVSAGVEAKDLTLARDLSGVYSLFVAVLSWT